MKFFAIITFLNSLAIHDVSSFHVRPRVIEGYNTTDYPYVVVLVARHPNYPGLYERFCSGTLITDRWVLTCAHCSEGNISFLLSYGIIMFGDLTLPLDNSTSNSRILEIVPHPQYKYLVNPTVSPLFAHDIALHRVEPVVMPSYGKLSAVDYKSLIGRPVISVGGGLTATDLQLKKPRILQEISKKDQLRPLQIGEAVVSPCSNEEKKAAYDVAMLCLRPKCSKKSQRIQKGDSGGPLLYRGKIVGVSFAVIHDTPSAMCIPVSLYIDWIRDVTSRKI